MKTPWWNTKNWTAFRVVQVEKSTYESPQYGKDRPIAHLVTVEFGREGVMGLLGVRPRTKEFVTNFGARWFDAETGRPIDDPLRSTLEGLLDGFWVTRPWQEQRSNIDSDASFDKDVAVGNSDADGQPSAPSTSHSWGILNGNPRFASSVAPAPSRFSEDDVDVDLDDESDTSSLEAETDRMLDDTLALLVAEETLNANAEKEAASSRIPPTGDGDQDTPSLDDPSTWTPMSNSPEDRRNPHTGLTVAEQRALIREQTGLPCTPPSAGAPNPAKRCIARRDPLDAPDFYCGSDPFRP